MALQSCGGCRKSVRSGTTLRLAAGVPSGRWFAGSLVRHRRRSLARLRAGSAPRPAAQSATIHVFPGDTIPSHPSLEISWPRTGATTEGHFTILSGRSPKEFQSNSSRGWNFSISDGVSFEFESAVPEDGPSHSSIWFSWKRIFLVGGFA